MEKEYLAQSEIESQLLTDLDFLVHIFMQILLQLKKLLTKSLWIFRSDGVFIKDIIALLETAWEESEIEQFKNSLIEVNKSITKIKKLTLNIIN